MGFGRDEEEDGRRQCDVPVVRQAEQIVSGPQRLLLLGKPYDLLAMEAVALEGSDQRPSGQEPFH